jgi:hypothetical protein
MEILESDGVETLYVQGATVSTLTPFLNPQVPWIWVLGHRPNRFVEWWQTSLPVNKEGSPITAEFRLVGYDLLLPTSRFLELAAEFEDHGLVLVQSHQRMPNTLDLSRIPDNQQTTVLRSNGAFLRIYLPHAIETAQVQCFEKGFLASVTVPNNSFKADA